MFETLEDMSERSKKPVPLRWAILEYSVFALVGLLYIIDELRWHHPLGAVVGTAVCLLSLIWLITTVRSPAPVRRRVFWIRGQILIWIMMAYEIAYTVFGRMI
jgi:hypothetical protein